MNYFDHSSLSVQKFGGVETDYISIHKFLDSSKLFYHHAKHRLLLHHLFGVDLAIQKFGDFIQNQSGQTILVRDIAVEHCKEDLSGVVPTLNAWLHNNENLYEPPRIPEFKDSILEAFIYAPYIRTGCKAALLLTCSNFGIYLTEQILGHQYARNLQELMPNLPPVEHYLKHYQYSAHWQFSPDKAALKWLQNYKSKNKEVTKITSIKRY